jgi:flap endonuclease-1
MGNAAFRDLAVIRELDDENLSGATVAVDASNWLYKYLYNTVKFNDRSIYTTPDGEELPNLVATVVGLNKFFEHNLTPVFVFDGRPHDLKANELETRREARKEATQKQEEARKVGDAIQASNYEARSLSLTGDITETTKRLLEYLDVPYITAPGAAEAQAARLCADGVVQYVISDDYDTLLFGSPRTVRNFTSASRSLELLDFSATLDEHGLTHKQLVEVGLLCGTDYNEGVKGIGPKTGVKNVAEHGDLEGVLDAKDATVDQFAAVRDIFLTVEETTHGDYQPSLPIEPALDEAWEYVTEEWGLNSEKFEKAYETLRGHFEQPGLDRWS